MNIEKITLKNLTSLEGEHTIDFTAEPLRSAGLFAITGNTGAGKSTILDAVCLALYGRSPKLDNVENLTPQNREDAGEATPEIPIGDVRNILRRGAADGFARVEFATPAGERYAATWSVRINRNGHLAPATKALEQTAPKKRQVATGSEVQAEVERIIGLDYEQFSRTVILAQGSFSKFLSAKSGDKSALLEKVTGTEIYSRISRNIFDMEREARASLDTLKANVAGMTTGRLEPEEVSENEERTTLLRAEMADRDTQIATIRKQQQWCADFAAATERHKQAEEAFNAANKELMSMREDELLLARYDSVLEVKDIYRDIINHRRQIEKYRADITAVMTLIDQQRAEVNKAQKRLDVARERKADADKQLEEQRSLIENGKRLAFDIESTAKRLDELEGYLTRTQQAQQAREKDFASKCKEIDDLKAELDRLKVRKQALSVHQRMFDHYQLVIDKLRSLEDKSEENDNSHKELKRLQEIRTKLGKACADHRAALIKQEEQLHQLRGELESAAQNIKGKDGISLQKRTNESSNRLIRLRQARTLWANIVSGYEEIEEKSLERDRTKRSLGYMQADHERMRHEVETKKALSDTFYKSYTLSQSENIVQLRQGLKEGQPCPVCGSAHHPYHTETERELGNLMTNLEQNYLQAHREYEEKAGKWAELGREISKMEGTADAIENALEERRKRQATDVSDWNNYADLDMSFELCTPTVNREARATTIDMLIDSTTRIADDTRRELDNFNYYQGIINSLNAKISTLSTDMRTMYDVLKEEETSLRVAEESYKKEQRTAQETDKEVGRLFDDLRENITVSGWLQEWNKNADGLRAKVKQLFDEWTITCQQLEKDCNALDLRGQELGSAERDLEKARAEVVQARNERDKVRGELRLMTENMRTTFGSSTPSQLEESLRKAAVAEMNTLETVNKEYEEALRALHSSEANRHTCERNSRQEQEDLSNRMQELDQWIAKYNGVASHTTLQPYELECIFADTRNWPALRARLDDVRARHLLASKDKERAYTAVLQVQRDTNRPAEAEKANAAAFAEKIDLLEKEKSQLAEELAVLNKRLTLHYEAVKQAESYKQQLAKAEDNALQWQRLSAMFGSRDGKRFREQAQCYTFSLLVQYANLHLQRLTPRYSLKNLPATLALQIEDRDMLGETRFVSSLSGGETFVVSLALALGLASLSTGSLNIGSLFIDEGFGHLDQQSLSLVLSVLSSLENSEGRKVGVVSHTEQIQSQIYPQIHVVRLPAGGASTIEIV